LSVGSVNVNGVAQDELFTVNADIAPPPERTESNAGVEPQADPASSPLAVRMRPRSLDEVVGQQHLLREGAPLRRLVEGAAPASVLLYGAPGPGRTTIARLLAGVGERQGGAVGGGGGGGWGVG
jgi:putative ATPase